MAEESPAYAGELRRLVGEYAETLKRMDDVAIHRRPGPGKWSIAEIVGHLVDSASNNHQRFVRGRWQDSLVFTGYEQDEWVAAQHYQAADFPAVLALWRSFNLHLAHVMETTPAPVRHRAYIEHNLDQVSFSQLPADTPATLDWFMEDYVEHFKHHLRQIDALLPS